MIYDENSEMFVFLCCNRWIKHFIICKMIKVRQSLKIIWSRKMNIATKIWISTFYCLAPSVMEALEAFTQLHHFSGVSQRKSFNPVPMHWRSLAAICFEQTNKQTLKEKCSTLFLCISVLFFWIMLSTWVVKILISTRKKQTWATQKHRKTVMCAQVTVWILLYGIYCECNNLPLCKHEERRGSSLWWFDIFIILCCLSHRGSKDRSPQLSAGGQRPRTLTGRTARDSQANNFQLFQLPQF